MSDAPRPTTRRVADALLTLLFLAAVAAPLVMQLLRPTSAVEAERRERRKLRTFPNLRASRASIESFPGRFAGYYADQFGLREDLVRLHNRLKWFGFRTAPSPNVVQGEDNWLFFAEDHVLDQVRGAMPFTRDELEGWQHMLEARRDWLAAHGMHYLFVLGPTKGQIYPEYLPPAYRPIGPSRLEQLVDHMARESDVELLDLRAPLLEEKRHDEGQDWVYYPLGTHWTYRGAFVAYREILARLRPWFFPDLELPTKADFRKRLTKGQGDSWAERLYLDDRLQQEDWALVPKRPAVKSKVIPNARIAEAFEQDAPDLPRGVLFHDSFALLLKPMLAGDFSRLTCIWQSHFDLARIEEERPDVVIDMMVERVLTRNFPDTLPLDSEADLVAAFEASDRKVLGLDPLKPPGLRAVGESHFERIPRRPDRGLAIEPGTGVGLFDFPEFAAPPGDEIVLRLDLTAPEDTVVELLYPRGPVLDYPRAMAVRVFVHAGRQLVHARIRPAWFTHDGPLRFASASRAGRWIVHRIEARAVPAIPRS